MRGDCTPAPRACWACFARPLNAVARSAQEERANHRSPRRTCIRPPSTLSAQRSALSHQPSPTSQPSRRPGATASTPRGPRAQPVGLTLTTPQTWGWRTCAPGNGCARPRSADGASATRARDQSRRRGRLRRGAYGGLAVAGGACIRQPSRRPGATASTPRSPRAQPVGLSPPRSQTRGWRTYVPGNGCARPRSVGGLMGRRDWPGGGGGARSARAEGPASSRAGGRARGRQPARGLAELDAAVDEDRLAGDVVGVL